MPPAAPAAAGLDATRGEFARQGGGYAWYVAAVLSLAYCFSFIDRQILNLLVVPIQADLGISDTQMSLLQGFAFAIFYTTLGVPFGWLADRWNRRNLIICGVAFWCLATVACGFATSYAELFLARVGVGIGEAVLTPAAMSLLTDYFPRHRLARAVGLFSAGSSVGATLAYLGGGAIVEAVTSAGALELPGIGAVAPWHATFILVGLPGFIVVVFMLFVREPPRRDTVAAVPLAGEERLLGVVQFLTSRRNLFTRLYLGLALLILMSYAIHAWIPAYLTRVHGWSTGQLGLIYGLVILFGSVPGLMFGGWLGDRLVHRGRSDGHVVVAATGAGLAIVPCVLGPIAPDAYVGMALLWLGNFFFSMPFGTGPAALQIVTPKHLRAQIAAVYILVVGLIGLAFGPTSVALLTDYVFRDPAMVGWSIAIVAGLCTPLSLWLLASARRPYRELSASAAASRSQ